MARSPEANLRKKLTGRLRILIITELCTAIDVFVLIRSISSSLTIEISHVAKAAATRKIPAPIIRFICRPFRILPVSMP